MADETTLDPMAPPKPWQMKTDPALQAAQTEAKKTALDIIDATDALAALGPDDKIKAFAYRIAAGGKYEMVGTYYWPFDVDSVQEEVKETYGPGDYQLRLMVNGKLHRNFNWSIAKERLQPHQKPAAPATGNSDMMMLMQMMMQQNQASADRQMQMMTAMQTSQTTMLTAILPAMMGGKEKTSDLLAAFAALQGKGDKGGGPTETIELMRAVKELMGDGSPDFDGDAIGSIVKAAGPIIQGLGRAAGAAQAQLPAPVQVDPFPEGEPGQVRMIPMGDPIPQAQPAPLRFPVLAKVREDVLYLFGRRVEPGQAADIIMNAIERENVGDYELDQLAATFALSSDPLEDLATEGIDLRADPLWAGMVLTELRQLFPDLGGGDGDSQRGGGSEADPARNGAPGQGGVKKHGGKKPSGAADAAS